MATAGGDFEGALGGFLALDVGEIGACSGEIGDSALGRGEDLRALEVIEERKEIGSGENIDIAGPGGFGALGGGADEAEFVLGGVKRCEQHAGDRAEAAIEAELSDREKAIERIGRHDAHGAEQAERYRQIIV